MADTEKLGKYWIVEAIGSGGFATVYRAVDATLGREVALKVLRPDLLGDPLFVARFYQEARTIATLRHPHIVTVFEVGEAEGRLFIAMDLAAGSLAARLKERGPLPWAEALALLGDTARALDYAHGRGVIHRDLKPANILLDSFGEALISDFGVASLLHPEPREDGSVHDTEARDTVIGTPAYIAPEIWNGKRATPATDIYALACIAYELLSGRQLFPAATKLDALAAHGAGPQFAAGWAGPATADAEPVLRKALDREPARRHGGATELWRELKAAEPYATQELALGGVTPVLVDKAPAPLPPLVEATAAPRLEPAPDPERGPRRAAALLGGRPGCTLVVTLALLLALGGLGGYAAVFGGKGTAMSATAIVSAGPSSAPPATPAAPTPDGGATAAAVAAATSEREAQLTAEAAFNAGQASIVQTITAEAGVTQTADAAAIETTTASAATAAAAGQPAPEPSATSQPAPEPSATTRPAPEPSATSRPAPEPSATTRPAPTRTTGPTRTPAPTSAPPPQPTATSGQGGSVIGGGNGDYFTARVDGPVTEGGASGSCIIGTVRRSGGGLFQSFDVQVSNGRETRRANTSFGSGEYSICGLGADTWGVAVYAYDGLDVPSSEEAKHQVRLRASGAAGERFFVHFTGRAGIPEPTAAPTVAPTATPFSRFDGTWEGELRGITGDTSFAGRFAFVIKEGRLLYTGSSGASCAWEDYGLSVAVGEGGFRVGKRVGGNERIYYEAVASFSSATEATGTLYSDDGSGAPCIRDATWAARRTGG